MHQLIKIRKEHNEIHRKLDKIELAFKSQADREYIKELLGEFESFWAQHEEREEKFLDWFSEHGGEFPYHKMLISQHRQLKGHWTVLKDFLENHDDQKLEVAFETDGKMIFDKFKEHIAREEEYFARYFKK